MAGAGDGGAGAGFNPRTREGATVAGGQVCGLFPCFNPRTREGATKTFTGGITLADVSIHAPVRVRLGIFWNTLARCQFQSTHP